jgi:hypothetical protein
MIATLAMNLDNQTLEEIQRLEKEIGCPILAFSPKGVEPAELDESSLAKIRELEEKRGLSLIAVK